MTEIQHQHFCDTLLNDQTIEKEKSKSVFHCTFSPISIEEKQTSPKNVTKISRQF